MVYKECSTAFWLLPDAFAAGENFLENEGEGFSLPLTFYIYIIAFLCRGSCRSHPQPR